jgi:hypothetical protein
MAEQKQIDIRELIIKELRAEALSPEEQETLMKEVQSALLERASLAIMRRVPPEILAEMSEEELMPKDPESANAIMQKLAAHVPDIEAVVTKELQDGLKAYQDYLDNEVEKVTP